MSERQPRQEYDASALAGALKTGGEERRDVAYGDGVGFRLGQEQHTSLEYYPTTGVARIMTAQARIELFWQQPPVVEAEGVLFEQRSEDQSLTLSVTPDGAVSLAVSTVRHETSSGANDVPLTQSTTATRPILCGEEQDAAVADSGAPERPSRSESPLPEATEQEEKCRVNLTGRVGAVPAFRTTPKGVFIGRFPLAVRDEEDQTHWHSILTFNDRARKLQEAKLAKGQLVGVTGYVHEREQPTRGGEKKVIEEIYAVVIRLR